MKKKKKSEKRNSKIGVGRIIFAIVILLIVVCVVFFGRQFISKEPEVSINSISTLEKVLEISDLSTGKYDYNAVAAVYDENQNEKYYVAYEGTVTAGIDFSRVDIKADDDERKIIVSIPDIEIQDTIVDPGTLSYIFKDSKYEIETVSDEAYKACKADLNERVNADDKLYDTARENAISTIKGLLEPLVESWNNGYALDVR